MTIKDIINKMDDDWENYCNNNEYINYNNFQFYEKNFKKNWLKMNMNLFPNGINDIPFDHSFLKCCDISSIDLLK